LPLGEFAGQAASIRRPAAEGPGRWPVELLQILPHHPLTTVARRKPDHAGPDHGRPAYWNPRLIPFIKEGHHLLLQEAVEHPRLLFVPAGLGMLSPVSQTPSHLRIIGLIPPAVQIGEIQAPVGQDLHAAGTAGLIGPAGGVDPYIHAGLQVLGQVDVVVGEKDRPIGYIRSGGKAGHLPDHLLSLLVGGMGFGGHDQLHRALIVLKNGCQAFGIRQKKVGALVGRGPPGKAYGQKVGIEDMFCRLQLLLSSSSLYLLPEVSAADILHQIPAGFGSEAPEILIASLCQAILKVVYSLRAAATGAGLAPQTLRCRGIPGRNMNPVGHIIHRHLPLWPAGIAGLEYPAADPAMQPGYPIGMAAAAHSQMGHIE